MKTSVCILLAFLASIVAPLAALTDQLVAYYNFEEVGALGLSNKVEGAITHNGTYIGVPSNGAGSGFSGSANFEGANADAATDPANKTTNRPAFVGNVLNVVKGTASASNGGQFTISTLSSLGRGLGTAGEEFGSLGKQFAVSVWFYLAPDPDNATLSDNRRFVFESILDGASTAQVYDISWGTTGGNTIYTPFAGQTSFSSSTVPADGWHHVVHSFTTEGSNTRLTVHVDGIQTATGTVATSSVDFRGINFGTNRAGNARVFDGMIDEVALWSRPLSTTEVTDLYQRGVRRVTLVEPDNLVNLTVSPTGAGTVNGSGVYTPGAQADISAVANPGFIFSGWSGAFEGQPAKFVYTVSGQEHSTALFSPDLTDLDSDGLSNYDEIVIYQTDPHNADTDGDRIPDGAEVNLAGTNPNASDETLVSFVRNNLSEDGAGAITLSPLRMKQNPITGQLNISFRLWCSPDKSSWQEINLGAPGVSISEANDGWKVTFPAPSIILDRYILIGSQQ